VVNCFPRFSLAAFPSFLRTSFPVGWWLLFWFFPVAQRRAPPLTFLPPSFPFFVAKHWSSPARTLPFPLPCEMRLLSPITLFHPSPPWALNGIDSISPLSLSAFICCRSQYERSRALVGRVPFNGRTIFSLARSLSPFRIPSYFF